MAVDPVLVENTRAWLTRAIDDLNVADHDLKANPPFVRAALFHCQQAVEKALKGFLTWHDRPFRKTHDLGRLGDQCAEVDGGLGPIVEPAIPLTRGAWEFRYPGEMREPTVEESQEALALARQVVSAILDRLPAAVRP